MAAVVGLVLDQITVSALVPLFAPLAGQPHTLVDQPGQVDALGQRGRGQ